MNLKELDRELRRDSDYRYDEKKLEADLSFNVGKMIIEARIYKGITQKQLAELVGTKQPSIARIENGKSTPTLFFLQKIALALDTKLVLPKFEFEKEYLISTETINTDVRFEFVPIKKGGFEVGMEKVRAFFKNPASIAMSDAYRINQTI